MEKIIEFFSDSRNVVDEFKGVSSEIIKEKLQERSLPFAVAMTHLTHDFNLGTVLRNANGFGAREMFYIGGKKSWDRRSAVGSHHFTNFQYIKTIEEFIELKKQYLFVSMENTSEAISLESFNWGNFERPVMIIIGEEKEGIPAFILENSDSVVKIPQIGSVRSYNAGVASGIAMFDFYSKFIRHN